VTPDDARGRRRRAELVAAGVTLLAESGWEGLTHRAVAARAQANPGLVHYYFKGTHGLRLAVAADAIDSSIGGVFEHVLAAQDDGALVENVIGLLSSVRSDAASGRVTAELVSATFGDPEIGDLVRRAFAEGRTGLEKWLRTHHPSWRPAQARGTAAVITGMIDGLMLHLLLDPDLRVREVAHTTRQALLDLVR
jgi:AcrR family transcriptional regulator